VGSWSFCNLALTCLSLWPSSTNSDSTMAPLAKETSKWSVLTYTQRYTDDKDESVFYHGTLFVQLSKVSIEGCDLKLSVHVQDRFDGTTSKRQTFRSETTDLGPQSETFDYEYLLKLTDLRQIEEKVVVGRPAQIQGRTGFNCEEQPSCELTWLDVKVSSPLIREVRTKDDITDFDEMVREITIPISSRQTAQDSATAIQDLAAGCHSTAVRK
jgi:hypothetical protein